MNRLITLSSVMIGLVAIGITIFFSNILPQYNSQLLTPSMDYTIKNCAINFFFFGSATYFLLSILHGLSELNKKNDKENPERGREALKPIVLSFLFLVAIFAVKYDVTKNEFSKRPIDSQKIFQENLSWQDIKGRYDKSPKFKLAIKSMLYKGNYNSNDLSEMIEEYWDEPEILKMIIDGAITRFSPQNLFRLYEHKNEDIRVSVIRNASSLRFSDALVKKIEQDIVTSKENSIVIKKQLLLSSPDKLGSATVYALAVDKDKEIQMIVAGNKYHTPLPLLQDIISSKGNMYDQDVKLAALFSYIGSFVKLKAITNTHEVLKRGFDFFMTYNSEPKEILEFNKRLISILEEKDEILKSPKGYDINLGQKLKKVKMERLIQDLKEYCDDTIGGLYRSYRVYSACANIPIIVQD